MFPFDGGITGTANGFLVFAILLAGVYLHYLDRPSGPHKLACKTLPVALLAAIALDQGGPWLLVAALLLSAAGDFFLALEDRAERFFLAGLAAFLAGHIAYLVLFLALPASSSTIPASIAFAATAAMAAIAIVMARRLYPATGELRWPVMVYILAILAMGLAALRTGDVLIAAGAASFMASDAALAAERFLVSAGDPRRRLLGPFVWISYFAAQAMILLGVLL
ncbi:lysoplasmalogenase family protein [Oricola sp.]|uniref:lysoplasmalogenase family protein n=1 Tax=Oricola sp. TaxID=1979950 RepID=UPI003BAC5E30